MKYFLFLDDERMPKKATINQVPLATVTRIKDPQWEIVRNIYAFRQIIEGRGVPDVVSFDHDLSNDHVAHYVLSQKGAGFDYSLFNDTGYHCAEWLCQFCLDKQVPFPTWYVHSFNQHGTTNIKRLIYNFPHFKK